MVIHFSGMRYQSAHGSWADPRDLLESLKIEELTVKNKATTPEEIERAAAQALVELQKQKETETNKRNLSQIDRHIKMLESQFNKGRALLEIEIEKASREIEGLSEKEILQSLEAKKNQFPDWVWKEIVSRTALRLEADEADWETLTPEETQKR